MQPTLSVRALRIYVDRIRSFRSSEQLFVCHRGQQKGKAVSKQRLAHWIVDAIAWPTNYKASCAPWGWGLTPLGVLPPPMRWRTVPLWQTSVELRAGRHRTPLQGFTVFVLSQFLPVCWVTGKWQEELAGVTLAAPFPLTRGCECHFPPPVEFPGWWTLVEFLQHPRQSDWAEQSDVRPSIGVSLPGSPVSPYIELGVHMAWFPMGNSICVFFHGKVSLLVNLCLSSGRALCQALLTALLPTLR